MCGYDLPVAVLQCCKAALRVFESRTAYTHGLMSCILQTRGVY